MLRTFDENLVITAVQQLTTDLDSLSGRIKKLEEGGGGGGKLLYEKTYTDVEPTTSTSAQTFDTITLPADIFNVDDIIIITVDSDNYAVYPKVKETVTLCLFPTNFLTSSKAVISKYMPDSDTASLNVGTQGIYAATFSRASIDADWTFVIQQKYNATYGTMAGDVTVKIYKI